MAIDDRYERRKAKTRRAIVIAANELFEAKGYEATTMEDISVAAGVAIRTIYLHFDSKASVLLAHFDAWLDEFVRLFGEQPPGEALDVMTESVLATMADGGDWTDNRPLDERTGLHPAAEFIGGGDAVIAGHMMHSWVQAQERLTATFRLNRGVPPDSLRPTIEAAAVFAAWMTSVIAFRQHYLSDAPLQHNSHDIGEIAMRSMVEGLKTLRD